MSQQQPVPAAPQLKYKQKNKPSFGWNRTTVLMGHTPNLGTNIKISFTFNNTSEKELVHSSSRQAQQTLKPALMKSPTAENLHVFMKALKGINHIQRPKTKPHIGGFCSQYDESTNFTYTGHVSNSATF